jgi:hypothetical protein
MSVSEAFSIKNTAAGHFIVGRSVDGEKTSRI